MEHRHARMAGIGLAHFCSAVVVLQVGTFYAYVLRARLALGVWPIPYRPDPKDLEFSAHHNVVLLGGVATLMLTPFLAVVLIGAAKALRVPRGILARAALMFAVCYVGFVVLCYVDPGRFAEWMID